MWKRVFRLLCLLIVAGNIQAYINSEDGFSHRNRNSKSGFLDYHLSQFRSKVATTLRPRTLFANKSYPSSSNHRKYHNTRNIPVTESPVRRLESQHKFRHTRFPKMDVLLSKISRLDSDIKDKKSIHQRITTVSPVLRTVRTTTEPIEDLEDNYEDLDFEDNYNENTQKSDDASPDWDDDESDDDADDDDEEEREDERTGWQAEEATEAPDSSLTEFKWRHYGTRGRVEESRRNQRLPSHSNDYKEITAAVQHALRVNREAGCRIPKARVIAVQTVYPDPSKTFIPHCTVLHQCGDDAGCCRAESLTCAAKHTDRVELYFYATILGRPGNNVEKLVFYNHTECECVDRSSIMSNDHPTTGHLRSGVPFRPVPQDTQLAPATLRRCRCPELYSVQLTNDNHCRCDCSDGHRDCMRIKRGKEYFSLKDRLCIQNGQCGYPICDFGAYIRHSGRCPRKQEKIDSLSRIIPK